VVGRHVSHKTHRDLRK